MSLHPVLHKHVPNQFMSQNGISTQFTLGLPWKRFCPDSSLGLLVQPKSEEIKPRDIVEYFESNSQSSGGLIKKMYAMIDGIFILFEDPESAEKVWKWRPHRIKGKRVVTFVKSIPDFRESRLVVTPSANELLQDELKLLLTQCSSKTVEPKRVKSCPTNCLLALYDGRDKNDICEIVDKFKKRNPSHKIEFLRRSDCICVTNVPLDASDDEITSLFENSHRTGGGNITRIDRVKKEKSLLVYLSSFQDAERIIDRFRGKTLPLYGSPMKFSAYFHCLYNFHMNIDNLNNIDKYYAKNITSQNKPATSHSSSMSEEGKQTFCYTKIDADILNFMATKQDHIQLLNVALVGESMAKVGQHGLEITLSLNSKSFESDDFSTLKRRCLHRVESFMKDYISQKCICIDEASKTIIASKLQSNDENICIRWTSDKKDEIVVTGLKAEVESFISCIKVNRNNGTLQLKQEQIRWLADCGILKQIMEDFPVVIKCSEDFTSVDFSGNKEDVIKADLAVWQAVSQLRVQRYISSEERFMEFLKSAKRNEKLSQNVLEMFRKEKMHANLQFEGDWPHIWADKDNIDNSLAILNNNLIVDESVELILTNMNEAQSQGWKIISAMEANGEAQIVLKDKVLSIVGFKHFVSKAKEKLKGAFGDILTFRNVFKTDYGKAQFIVMKMDKFRELCRMNQIKSELVKEGILMKGTQRGLKTVEKSLVDWSDKIVMLKKSYKKFGLREFFDGDGGRSMLDSVGKLYKSTIVFESAQKNTSLVTKSYRDVLTRSRTQTNFDDNKPPFMTLGDLTISIRQGDITEESNDAIVNTTGIKFDLSRGTISRKILEKGGDIIGKEVSNSSGKSIRVSSSGRLKCKKILHTVIPNDRSKFVDCIIGILKEADDRKCKSVSLPAIGTGIIGLSSSESARMIFKAFEEFVKKFPKIKHLRRVDIVLFEDSHLPSFSNELKSRNEAFQAKKVISGATSPKKGKKTEKQTIHLNSTIKIGDLNVSVRQGDITLETNDAIVNSTGPQYDLSQGMVSMAIIRKGGIKIQDEVNSVSGKNIKVTGGGNLPCNIIIHVVTPKNPDKISQCLIEILCTAEKEHCSSISIPAIGTGNLKLPSFTVASILMKAMHEFVEKFPNTKYLVKVDFVIYEKSQMKDFRKGLLESENAYEKSRKKQLNRQEKSYDAKIYRSNDFDNDKLCDEIIFKICSLEKGDGEKAWDYLLGRINDSFPTEVIQDDMVKRLTNVEFKHFNELKQKYNVQIQISGDNLSIEGKRVNVLDVSYEIKDILKNLATNNKSKGPVREERLPISNDHFGSSSVDWKRYDSDSRGGNLA